MPSVIQTNLMALCSLASEVLQKLLLGCYNVMTPIIFILRCVLVVIVNVVIVTDVWSLGVILYMLIVGRSPFSYGSPNETLTHIMDGKYTIPSTVSAQCRRCVVCV